MRTAITRYLPGGQSSRRKSSTAIGPPGPARTAHVAVRPIRLRLEAEAFRGPWRCPTQTPRARPACRVSHGALLRSSRTREPSQIPPASWMIWALIGSPPSTAPLTYLRLASNLLFEVPWRQYALMNRNVGNRCTNRTDDTKNGFVKRTNVQVLSTAMKMRELRAGCLILMVFGLSQACGDGDAGVEGVDDSRSCGQGCRPMCAHEFVRIPEPKGGAPSSAGCDATTNKGGPDGHGEGRRVVCQG